MGWLDDINKWWKRLGDPRDPSYSDIDPEKYPRYQFYIEKCLDSVDVANFTKKTKFAEYDKAQEEEDEANEKKAA